MNRRDPTRMPGPTRWVLLLALVGAGAAGGCSDASPGAAGAADAAHDTSLSGALDGGDDAGAAQDDGDDAEPADAADEGDGACQPSSAYFDNESYALLPDSGPDAAPQPCFYFVDLPCGSSFQTGTGDEACYLYLTECANICKLGAFFDCQYWRGKGCVDGSANAKPGTPSTVACGLCFGVGQ